MKYWSWDIFPEQRAPVSRERERIRLVCTFPHPSYGSKTKVSKEAWYRLWFQKMLSDEG